MKPNVDCYSAGERAFMGAGQRLRARALSPLLGVLAMARVQPDHLTFLSLLAGLLFTPMWFLNRPAALVALVLHIALDGLDGPLARHLGVASSKGSFTDTMADQIVITTTTVTLMAAGQAGLLPGMAYVALYGAVVLFAFMRNLLDAPYAWLFRPRFYVYAWIVVEEYFLPNTLDYVLVAATLVLFLKFISGFYHIRAKL